MNNKIKALLLLLIIFSSCNVIQPIDRSKHSHGEKVENPPKASPKIMKKGIEEKKVESVKEEKKVVVTPIVKNSEKVNNYCKKIDLYFKKYKWGKSNCEKYQWHHVRNSYLGNPIIWKVFGDESKKKISNTTMIFCGVHGDEITPVKFCFDILADLQKNPDIIGDNLVIVAPLVAPDSFLKARPTRTNAKGVDVNRNFPTRDWNKNAIKLWKSRYRSDKRRNPGKKALSEQETIFQVNIINRYKPNKIISVHAPLTLIDYDGPESDPHGNTAHQLLIQMSDKAGKYRINNYPFFTGSLGNWAGNERSIPTYTVELPNTDWTKTKKFYTTFRTAIHHAIDHDLNKHDHEHKPENVTKN